MSDATLPPSMPDSAELARIASAKRWRLGSALAALVVPLLLLALFARQARRLDALADHGTQTTPLSVSARGRYLEYRYEVDGTSFISSVGRDQVPAPEAFDVRYLPEEPSFSRADSDGSRTRAEAAKNRANVPRILLGAFAFFALLAGVAHRDLKRRLSGKAQPRREISPRVLAIVTTALLLAMTVSVNLYDDVHAVETKAFGARPFGLSVTLVVSLVEAILAVPYFWVLEHGYRIVLSASRDGVFLSRAGLFVYFLDLRERRPELRTSQNMVLAGFAFFVLLAGSWIAYASALGI